MALEQITFNLGALDDAANSGKNYVSGQVFEVFNIDDTYADIFADSAGTIPIDQSGIQNISNSDGECKFFIDKGFYNIKSGGKTRQLNANFSFDFETVSDAVNARFISLLEGRRVFIVERGAYFNVVLSSSFSGNGDGIDELTSSSQSSYGFKLIIKSTMHVSAFGVQFGGADADDIFARIYEIEDVKNIDCSPPSTTPINVTNLDIPTRKTIFSSGNSTPTFKTSGISCFSSASFTSLTNVGTTIKDMMILGTSGVTQLLIDAYRLRRFTLSNVRLRDIDQTAIAFRDFAGNGNKYKDVDVEGRVVYTGTASTELGTNVKTTNLSMVNIGVDKALEIRNHVNPSFDGLHQNSDGSSASMIGIYLSEQCEGVHLNDIQQVRYGVGVKVDTGAVGVAPLATKITNSIFDQYVTAAIVADSVNDFQDVNNTFSYQLDTANAAPSVQIGGGCTNYKQSDPTFIANRKECVVIRAAARVTTITSLTVRDGSQSGTFADIRAEANASGFVINGVNSNTSNNVCVDITAGSGDNIRVFNVVAENAAIVDIQNGATGSNVKTERDNTTFRSYNFANLPSASSETYSLVYVEDRSREPAYSDGTNWRYLSDNTIVV